MNTDDPIVREILRLCSGPYLCEPIPLDYMYWGEEEQYTFLTDHAWGPVEYTSASGTWNAIYSAAESTHNWYLTKLEK